MNKEDSEKIKENISKFSNERLCEIIITSRYLKIMQDESIECMKELAKRREDGSLFEFEKYIEEEYKKLPSFNLDLRKILGPSWKDLQNLKDIK